MPVRIKTHKKKQIWTASTASSRC